MNAASLDKVNKKTKKKFFDVPIKVKDFLKILPALAADDLLWTFFLSVTG